MDMHAFSISWPSWPGLQQNKKSSHFPVLAALLCVWCVVCGVSVRGLIAFADFSRDLLVAQRTAKLKTKQPYC
jgi:hypothetical protein